MSNQTAIPGLQVKFAMCEMGHKTFRHALNEYIPVHRFLINDFIRHGVKGKFVKYVAWVLGLKKFIPNGWRPVKREIRVKEKPELPKQGRLDLFNPSDNRGDNHYKRKNRQDNVHLIGKKLSPKRWTQEELDLLETLYKQGKNNSEIADILPRSKKAIQTKLTKLGITERAKKCLQSIK